MALLFRRNFQQAHSKHKGVYDWHEHESQHLPSVTSSVNPEQEIEKKIPFVAHPFPSDLVYCYYHQFDILVRLPRPVLHWQFLLGNDDVSFTQMIADWCQDNSSNLPMFHSMWWCESHNSCHTQLLLIIISLLRYFSSTLHSCSQVSGGAPGVVPFQVNCRLWGFCVDGDNQQSCVVTKYIWITKYTPSHTVLSLNTWSRETRDRELMSAK